MWDVAASPTRRFVSRTDVSIHPSIPNQPTNQPKPRARIGAVFHCAAFFCRLKGGLGSHSADPPKAKAAASSSSAAAAAAAATNTTSSLASVAGGEGGGLPQVCKEELRRRLGTLLASLHCAGNGALSREEVDAMRRDDLLVSGWFLCGWVGGWVGG